MKLTIAAKELNAALKILTPAVETKTTIPILATFLIDGEGRAQASDLDVALRVSLGGKFEKPGRVCVPLKKLADFSGRLNGEEIKLRVLENHWVELKANGTRAKVVGMNAENFPSIPQAGTAAEWLSLPGDDFRKAIGRVSFAISREESRYTLNAALLEIEETGARMVATDGVRLAVAEFTGPGTKGRRTFLLPRKVLGILARTESDEIRLAEDESNLFFECGPLEISAKKLTGQFPNYEAVLPKESKTTVKMVAGEMRAALELVGAFADQRSHAVKLEAGEGSVKFTSSSPEYGEAERTVTAEVAGPGVTVGFNAGYLLEFLKKTEGTVTLRLDGSDKAGDFAAGEGYRYVVMPMRI